MTNMNVIPVSQDSYIVNGCKVKITYTEDGQYGGSSETDS